MLSFQNIWNRKKLGAIEQQIHQIFLSSKRTDHEELESQLYNPNAPSMAELPEDQKAYMQYIYSYLSDSTVPGVIQGDKIDGSSPEAEKLENETISLQGYLSVVLLMTGSIRQELEVSADIPVRMAATMPFVRYILDHLKG